MRQFCPKTERISLKARLIRHTSNDLLGMDQSQVFAVLHSSIEAGA
jgi:hypothetical protein